MANKFKGKRLVGQVRISDDKAGEGKGVGRQGGFLERWQADNDVTLLRIDVENDTGASHYSRNERPVFDANLREVEAGIIDGIVTSATDRMTRKLHEGEHLIDLAENHGKVFVMGDIDLTTARGREAYVDELGAAKREAMVISRRVRETMEDERAAGHTQLGGRRLFGYDRDLNGIESEAEIGREIVRRVAEGASCNSIARWLNGEGITTTGGKRWDSSGVKLWVTNPKISGRHTYNGEVIGQGYWDPIVQPAEQAAVLVALARWRKHPRAGRRRTHILHGLLLCDRCDSLLVRSSSNGRPGWHCHRSASNDACGRLTLDGKAEASILNELFKAVECQPVPITGVMVETAGTRATVEIEADIALLFDIRQDIAKADYDMRLAALRQEKAEAEAAKAPRSSMDRLIDGEQGPLSQVWEDLDEHVKRAILHRYIEWIRVKPGTKARWSEQVAIDRLEIRFRV
jgi:DNA invertase Pin-like site-specific DNA recombinase